ncbi:MAG: citrate/2-methylcitrate synthase, partial [Chloroflexi bacterium]|nr:citrate/2-methylcitrate synthase [Chloroflexota bacterium]
MAGAARFSRAHILIGSKNMTDTTVQHDPDMDVQRGLADVVAAHTRVGHVDGAQAKLWYCGYDAIELAQKSTYEEVVYLLLNGNLPTASQLEGFQRTLARYRNAAPAMLEFLRAFPGAPNPVDALRTMVSAMVATD